MTQRERDERIVQGFKRRRTHLYIAFVLAGIAVAFVYWWIGVLKISTEISLPLLAVAGLAVISILYYTGYFWFGWKCPACNGLFGIALEPKGLSKVRCSASLT